MGDTVANCDTRKAAAKDFDADHGGQDQGQTFFARFLFCADHQAEKDEKSDGGKYGQPDGFQREELFVAGKVGFKGQLFTNCRKKNNEGANTENAFFSDAFEIAKSAIGHGKQQKAEHKAIAVIEPVRTLEAVPDKLQGTDPEGKKQYALGFVLQDLDKTLTDNDVERVMSKLLATFQNEFGASLR